MLALITPTRRRWQWMTRQAEIIAGQLDRDDRWIVVADADQPPQDMWNEIDQQIGAERLVLVCLNYLHPMPPVACVNRARNVGAALAPAGYDLVEVDDHDLLEPFALSEIRRASEAGYDYVFGNFHQQALLVDPSGRRAFLEPWPDVTHDYRPGGFATREIEAIGLRAIRRALWERLGGWSDKVWPGGDFDFAERAERAGARIACLETPLCTVTVEPESLSGKYRGGEKG
jgi:hypothetical protein